MTFYSIAPGTTPTHVFSMPLSADMVKDIQITYTQGDTVLQKRLDDAELYGELVAVTLTQAETMMFCVGELVGIQLRILDMNDQAFASNMITAKVCRSNSTNILS